MSEKQILFLCTGNSCRSQMAEGFAKLYWGDRFDVISAGIEKHGMNALAVKVMREVDVDLSLHFSKTLGDLNNPTPDYVVTVCGHAHESCPALLSGKIIHAGFDDPPKLAANAQSEQEALPHYRRVRDEIKTFIETLPQRLADKR